MDLRARAPCAERADSADRHAPCCTPDPQRGPATRPDLSDRVLQHGRRPAATRGRPQPRVLSSRAAGTFRVLVWRGKDCGATRRLENYGEPANDIYAGTQASVV